MGNVLRLLGVGWFIGLCIFGGGFVGLWIDNRFGIGPVFTLLGLSMGVFLAVTGVYRMVKAVVFNSIQSKDQSNK